MLLERDLEVLLPEEFGVGETGGQHLLVARDDPSPPSLASMLATKTKCGASLPSDWQAKYFWLTRMVSWMTSRRQLPGRRDRNWPSNGTGNSVSPAFSATRPSSGTISTAPAASRGALPDQRLAFLRVDDDVAGAQLLDIIVGAADGDRAGMVEAVADRGRARISRRRSRIRRSPRRAGRRCPAAGGPSAGIRSTAKLRPSASTWARERRGRWRGSPRRGPRRSRGRACRSWRTARRRARPAARATRPVLRRKPSSACGGALARGPLISSLTASVCAGRPRAIRARRRGVT